MNVLHKTRVQTHKSNLSEKKTPTNKGILCLQSLSKIFQQCEKKMFLKNVIISYGEKKYIKYK